MSTTSQLATSGALAVQQAGLCRRGAAGGVVGDPGCGGDSQREQSLFHGSRATGWAMRTPLWSTVIFEWIILAARGYSESHRMSHGNDRLWIFEGIMAARAYSATRHEMSQSDSSMNRYTLEWSNIAGVIDWIVAKSLLRSWWAAMSAHQLMLGLVPMTFVMVD